MFSTTMYTQDFNGAAELVILGKTTTTPVPEYKCITRPVTPNFFVYAESGVSAKDFERIGRKQWTGDRECKCDCTDVHAYGDMPQMQPSVFGNDYTVFSFSCASNEDTTVNSAKRLKYSNSIKVELVNETMINIDGYADINSMHLYKVSADTFVEIKSAISMAKREEEWKVFNGHYSPLEMAKRKYPRCRPYAMCTEEGEFTQNIPGLDVPDDQLDPGSPPEEFYLRVLTFDIETCPTSGLSMFGKVENDDQIVQIGVCMAKFYPRDGSLEQDGPRVVLCNGETAPSKREEVKFISYTEVGMLRAFLGEWVAKVDFISGWNSDKFDLRWIMQRVERLEKQSPGINALMTRALNRATLFPTRLVQNAPRAWSAVFESAQRGKMDMVRFSHTRGVVAFDAMLQVQQMFPSQDRYTLDSIVKSLLGPEFQDGKIDLPYVEGFEMWKSGDPMKRHDLAVYCDRDVELTFELIKQKMLVSGFVELCVLFRLDPPFRNWKGVNSTLSPFNRIFAPLNVIEPTYHKDPDNGMTLAPHVVVPPKVFDEQGNYKGLKGGAGSYQGAMVIKPKLHICKEPVFVKGFKSLYPSIMIRDNCSPDTAIRSVTWKDGKCIKHLSFVPKSVREGIVPKALRILGEMRNKEKRKMKSAPPKMRPVHNQRQKGIKIGANSEYGYLGASTSAIPGKDIAAYVTMKGRDALQEATNFVETRDFHVPIPSTYDVTECLIKPIEVLPNGTVIYIKDVLYTTCVRGVRVLHIIGKNGIMEVIYGDTDSIFARIKGIMSNKLLILVALYIAEDFKEVFYGDMELELEKVIEPYSLFVKKKKYSGYEITWNFDKVTGERIDGEAKFSAHGHDLVRRSVSKFAQRTQKDMLMKLNRGKIDEALGIVRKACANVLAGEYQVQDYMMSAGYKKKEAKGGGILVAAQVVKNMGTAETTMLPSLGDRVMYMVHGLVGKKKAKVSSRVISDKQAILDKDKYYPCMGYYFDNQLVKKLKPILDIYVKEGHIEKNVIKRLFARSSYDEALYYNPKTAMFRPKAIKRTSGGHAVCRVKRAKLTHGEEFDGPLLSTMPCKKKFKATTKEE